MVKLARNVISTNGITHFLLENKSNSTDPIANVEFLRCVHITFQRVFIFSGLVLGCAAHFRASAACVFGEIYNNIVKNIEAAWRYLVLFKTSPSFLCAYSLARRKLNSWNSLRFSQKNSSRKESRWVSRRAM